MRGRSLVHEALCLLPCRDQFPLKLGVCVLEGSDAAFPALGYWRGFVWGLLNIGRLSHSLMPPCLFRVGDHKCKYTVEHGNDSGTRGNIITL